MKKRRNLSKLRNGQIGGQSAEVRVASRRHAARSWRQLDGDGQKNIRPSSRIGSQRLKRGRVALVSRPASASVRKGTPASKFQSRVAKQGSQCILQEARRGTVAG